MQNEAIPGFASQQTALLDSLYADLGQGIDWSTFLDQLVRATQSRSARILLTNVHADRVLASVKHNIDDADHRRYVEHYVNTCPWRLELAQKPKGQLYSTYLDFSCRQADFYRTEFFNDWAGPQDIHHGICGTVFALGAHNVQLLVQRTQGQGHYSHGELAQVNQFLPHLRQALRMEQLSAQISGRAHASVLASEVRPLPFVLLDRQARVIYASARAERFLQQPEVLSHKGSIGFRDSALEQRFRSALEQLAREDTEQQFSVRRYERASVSCFLTPIYPAANDLSLWSGEAYVAMYIYDPEQVAAIDHQQLMELFGLTESEAKVAVDIALGLDPLAIAERVGRSQHTVRAQLKAVFTKTRCHRQNQLAALVWQSPALRWVD